MIRSLFSGVSGLRNHQTRMDVLSNNISNVNTTGFKAGRANFQDGLNQLLRSGGASRNPMQAGTGINTASIGNDMGQGALQNTGRTLDMAIQGEGFFKVTDGINEFLTRDGAFFVDATGNLVNSLGYQLESINLGAGEQIAELSISPDGTITGKTITGVNVTGNIMLYSVPNPEGLQKAGNSLYTASIDTSGDIDAGNTPGTGGAGTIESGYLEMSNTDLSTEFTTMITTQRGYQANSRVITVSDTLLEELIQLKR